MYVRSYKKINHYFGHKQEHTYLGYIETTKMCTYSMYVSSPSLSRGGSRGFLGSTDPLQKYIREAKRMMYWYQYFMR